MNTFRSVGNKFSLAKNWILHLSVFKKASILVVIISVIWFSKPLIVKSQQTEPQYQTAQAERGTLIESITVSGSVTSANSSPVTTAVSGVVEEVYVKNGDTIEAGKPIAKLKLDQSSLQQQSSAYASYLSASNAIKTAEQGKSSSDVSMWSASQAVLDAQNEVNEKNDNPSDYTDLEKQSIEAGLVQAHKAFTASETKYLESDSSISTAKAQLNSSWLAYQETLPTILAPISGTVSDLSLQVGNIISGNTSSSSTTGSSSTSTTSSSKIATIKTTGTPTVSVNLTEVDVPKVKIGNKATLTFDAFADKTYTGKVISIDTAGAVSSGVTTYPTTIALDVPPENLYSNMSASAAIITNTKNNVILIPSGAVQTLNETSTVRVLKNGKAQTITVETGLSNDTQIEIVSGISEGDVVITGQTGAATNSKTTQTTSPFGGSTRGFGGGGIGSTPVRR